MSFEVAIGLEVHAELLTKTKIFCACRADFGGEPNTRVCPVCSGMPGALPKLNRTVVEYALRTGLALECDIIRNSKFDRKNYCYPDLPKAYQVSQLYVPICQNGCLEITVGGVRKKIGIRQIHMEEDAGKLTHEIESGTTFMDFNRCGVPLLEIVSQPDMRSGAEAIAYLEKLREILLYLGVCDCKMQEGSLRADINLSVCKKGGELGVRTEMKNMNSFKAIARAIEYETARQIAVLEKGGVVLQQTLRWDDVNGQSLSMRSKENAQDYRYFPEPDLLPIYIDDDWLCRVKNTLPELAHQKRARYKQNYGLEDADALVITSHKNISDLFETVAKQSKESLEAAHLFTGEIMRLMNQSNTLAENLALDANKLSYLVTLVSEGKINRNAYKEVVDAVFTHDVEPKSYITEKGLLMVNDNKAVTDAVDAVLRENQSAVHDYCSGKEKAFGFLVGQVMKRLNGAGNPEIVRKVLKSRLV